jgi:hypothetical protein
MVTVHLEQRMAEWFHRLRKSADQCIRDPLVWLFILLGMISFGLFLYFFFAQPQPEAPWHVYFP